MSNNNQNGRKFFNFTKTTVRLGTQPEAKYSAAGSLWTRCRASLSMGKDDSGEYKPSLWVTLKAFSHEGNSTLPETLNALNKGAWVTVSGRLAYEEYETSEGEKRSDISIIVSKLEPLAEPAAEPKAEVAEAVAEGDFNPPDEEGMPF